jgi:prepilin-type processing-associated H-X9-DG protein
MWPTKTFTISACSETAVVNPARMRSMSDAILFGMGDSPNTAYGEDYIDLNIGGGTDFVPGGRSEGVAMEKRRHNGRFNTLYCDGHVDSLRRTQYFDWYSDAGLREWNNDDRSHREMIHLGEMGLNPPQ